MFSLFITLNCVHWGWPKYCELNLFSYLTSFHIQTTTTVHDKWCNGRRRCITDKLNQIKLPQLLAEEPQQIMLIRQIARLTSMIWNKEWMPTATRRSILASTSALPPLCTHLSINQECHAQRLHQSIEPLWKPNLPSCATSRRGNYCSSIR
jgi:hypothetical protein